LKFGGDVHDRDIVTIIVNRACYTHPSHAAKNVADIGSDSYFYSANEPNQSIAFDFRNLMIMSTHYSLRMHHPRPNQYYLKNWALESSRDGNSWMYLDRCENNSDLNSFFALKTFSIARFDPVRVIHLRQIGPNHRNDNYLIFTSFEIFGSMVGIE
jgi:hypothetical protein